MSNLVVTNIRVSKAELQRYRQLAQAVGMSLSQLIRAVVGQYTHQKLVSGKVDVRRIAGLPCSNHGKLNPFGSSGRCAERRGLAAEQAERTRAIPLTWCVHNPPMVLAGLVLFSGLGRAFWCLVSTRTYQVSKKAMQGGKAPLSPVA